VAYVEFPQIRTQDRLKEAQAILLELQAAKIKYLFGWATTDELSREFVDHAPVGEPNLELLFGAMPDSSVEEPVEEVTGDKASQTLLQQQLDDMLGSIPGTNGRAYGLEQDVRESQYFKRLPAYMKHRINGTEKSVVAFASMRRERIYDDLEDEE